MEEEKVHTQRFAAATRARKGCIQDWMFHQQLVQKRHVLPLVQSQRDRLHLCPWHPMGIFSAEMGSSEPYLAGTRHDCALPQSHVLGEKKTGHLRSLENASENLKLFKADLLDYQEMKAAIAGCQGVFHVASPVPSANLTDPELEVVRPAVAGTKNVLEAASAAKVRRVIVVSSIVAVDINPKGWPIDKIKDENSWSDREFCRNNEDWYSVSKITAEEAALEYGRETGLDVVTLNPAVVFGPLLQPTVNASSQFLIYFLKGGPDRMRDKLWHIVDVRDTADALLLLYEAPEASGRHICAPHIITARNLRELLKSTYPEYPHISKDSIDDMEHPAPMTTDKLKKLGWSCRSLEETIADTVEFCHQSGLLDDVEGAEPWRFPPVYNKI